MAQRTLADLEPGEKARLTVYIHERRRSVTKDDIPYAELVVCDKSTSRMPAHKWNLTEPEWTTMARAEYLTVVGRAKLSRSPRSGSAMEFVIESFTETRDVSHRDFLRQPECNMALEWKRFTALVCAVNDPDLSRLLRALFGDKAFRTGYLEAPAAQQRHHPYRGGLLEHSVEVAELALAVCDRMDHLNRDLLVTGALLHDVGKVREMRCDRPGYEFTADGGLMGHVMLGADIIREATRNLPDFSDDTRNRLIHLILSHHGRREWGAPVEPATAEALLLHACDQISAQMYYCRDAHRHPSADLFVWVPALERRLYRGQPDAARPAEPADTTDALPGNPFTDDVFAPPESPAGTPPLRIVAGGLDTGDVLPEMMALPIYGAIAAGAAIRSEQNLEGFRAVAVTGHREAEDFLLRVSGDSMRDAHILDGDLVRVRPRAEAREGDVIAALVNGDVTVKRLHHTPDGVTLRAANPAHPDIPIGQADAFSIQGVVVGLLRESMA